MDALVIVILGLAAFTAVVRPFYRSRSTPPIEETGTAASADAGGTARAALEEEIARYGLALRAGTVCGRCGNANPDHSRFCMECGRQLATAGPAGAGRS